MKTSYLLPSATAWVTPDLLKALAIFRNSCQKICRSHKRPHFSRWSTNLIFTSFSRTLLTIERRLTGRQSLAKHFSPTFVNTEITGETFQQFGKQDSFRHILKSSASMYEKSGSQFFRATGMQSRPFQPVMNFSTNVGGTKILCSFRLVLEAKTGKEILEPD